MTDADFKDKLLDIAAGPPDEICPFCGCIYEDGEYEYREYGCSEQISPAHCWDCGAYQLGGWRMNPKTQVYFQGWVRDRQPGDENKYPPPPAFVLIDNGENDAFLDRVKALTDEDEQKRIQALVKEKLAEDDTDAEFMQFLQRLVEEDE